MRSADALLDNGWALGLEQFFPGDSEMAQSMRAFDWSQTELGPPGGWPENLQLAVRMCLTSALPISLCWGPRRLLLYNDAYLPRLGSSNRQRALLRPACEVWSESWHVIGPMLERVVATGVAAGAECQELFYDRQVPREEVYISWSFGPILAAGGLGVDGVFCPCAEHTEKVIGARRLATLNQLAARSSGKRSVAEACQDAAALLRQNPRDIAFAAIYVVSPGEDEARCTATVVAAGAPRLPDAVSLHDPDPRSPWPLTEALRAKRAIDCTDLESRGIQISGSEWQEPVRQAIVLPLQASEDAVAGLLVVGVSPRRPLDTEYRTFFDLVAAHVSSAIAGASAAEAELQRAEAQARARSLDETDLNAQLLTLKDKLANDLRAMTLLHDLATRLLSNAGLEQRLEDVLDTSITLAGADFGHVQLYDEDAGTLKVVAQRGFEPEYLRYIEGVNQKLDTANCFGRAERVTFEDVLNEPAFRAHLSALPGLGYRALHATPLRGSCGKLLGVISTHFRQPHRPSDRALRYLSLCARHAEELIERQRAEQALRASDERFRRYFDLGLIGMLILSNSKGCLEVNDELCRILGYERHELVGKTCTEVTHPDDRAADDVQLARVAAGEIDGYSLDKRCLRRDGSVIDVIVAVQCVRRSDRSVDYFVGLVQDITARKLADAALLEARAELARITRVTTMGELAASIAHEVNQPLTAIIANANACARWLGTSPPNLTEANAAMDRLVRDAKRAAAVLAGIRAFLKRQPPQRTTFDLNELIVEVMAMLQGPLRANGVSSSVAPARGTALVTGDRVQLQQVMLNLIMNSIEAMASSTNMARRLQVDVEFAGLDELSVSVRDSGIGLTFEHRARIFDAFHTTKPQGMGMGLAISRSIVEAHGGRLWLAPKQGPGETFQFTLPAARREIFPAPDAN